jgi:hypothetical protein
MPATGLRTNRRSPPGLRHGYAIAQRAGFPRQHRQAMTGAADRAVSAEEPGMCGDDGIAETNDDLIAMAMNAQATAQRA